MDNAQTMEPADSIVRLGFARWYERRLIEAHAWFVSVFFCMVAIAACLEELSFRGSTLRSLLYTGIVALMKPAASNALIYTIAVIVCAIIVWVVILAIPAMLFGMGMMM